MPIPSSTRIKERCLDQAYVLKGRLHELVQTEFLALLKMPGVSNHDAAQGPPILGHTGEGDPT
jgi:hypothetical protein